MEYLFPILGSYLVQVPLLLVWLVGIFLAMFRWGRHSKVSLLMLIALIILFAQSLFGTFLSVWLPLSATRDGGMSATQLGSMMSMVGIVRTISTTIAWILILIAVFGWRQEGFE